MIPSYSLTDDYGVKNCIYPGFPATSFSDFTYYQ